MKTAEIAQRLTMALDSIEQAWIGKTVGIAYECDTDTGRIVITFQSMSDPAQCVTVRAHVTDVDVGTGPKN